MSLPLDSLEAKKPPHSARTVSSFLGELACCGTVADCWLVTYSAICFEGAAARQILELEESQFA